MHALRVKLASLRNTAVNGIRNYTAVFDKFVSATSQLLRIYCGQTREIGEVRALYQKEALQRKLLYNEVRLCIGHKESMF
jgi:hypothetical protein